MLDSYLIGQDVELLATFKDNAGVLRDPPVVVLYLKDPAGTVTTPTPVRLDTGTYHVVVTPTQWDRFAWRWEAHPTPNTVAEGAFWVQRGGFA